MNHRIQERRVRRAPAFVRRLVLGAVTSAVLTAGSSWAGPGAHGPNGEHLDGPTAVVDVKFSPRIEAKSELFELVGTLADGELSLLIDRYATNEPVLRADVEVEVAGLKAKAAFHADLGDYVVSDAKVMDALKAAGEHALLVTVLAGDDADLLEGVLRVPDAGALAHNDSNFSGAGWWVGGGVVAAALLLWIRRRRAAALRAKKEQGSWA